jgi:hypothetical protein
MQTNFAWKRYRVRRTASVTSVLRRVCRTRFSLQEECLFRVPPAYWWFEETTPPWRTLSH